MKTAKELKNIATDAREELKAIHKAKVEESMKPLLVFMTEAAERGIFKVSMGRGSLYDDYYEDEIIATLESLGYKVELTEEDIDIGWD